MTARSRWTRRTGRPTPAGAALLVLLLASPAAAAPAQPSVRIDLEALLTDPRVTATTLEDPVWRVALAEGSTLFQVPVRVTPGDEAGVLGRPEGGLTGDAFLGWSVPPVVEEAARGRAGAPEDTAPRVATSLTVSPDGTLSWEAERLGRDFEVATAGAGDGSLYPLLLDRDALRDLRPEPPERSADRAEARRAADEYREARDDWARLADAVEALPERIERPLPPVVWLVYERRRPDAPLSFEDPARGGWRVEGPVLEALRGLAGSAGGRPSAEAGALPPAARLVRAEEPLGVEAVALAAGRAVAGGGEGPAVALAEAVAERGDEAAARRLIFELGKAVPPTPTTVRLIAAAAPRAGSFGRVAALKARLLGLEDTPAGVPDPAAAAAVAELQRLLEDPEGPPVAQLVRALGDAVDAGGGGGGGREAGAGGLVQLAASAVQPSSLPPDRLQALIDAVLREAAGPAPADAAGGGPAAGEGPTLAEALLDRTLLRSFDPAVAGSTLRALNAAGVGGSRVGPVLGLLRAAVSSPAAPAPDAAPGADAVEAEDAADPVRLAAGSLRLQPADHGLLQQLRSGDPGIRAAAASALRLFRLPEGRSSGGASGAEETLEALLSATGDAAPGGLVTLLARSPDAPAVNAALLRLLGRAQGQAQGRVLFRLSGSGRSLSPALADLSDEEKVAVAAAVLPGSGTPAAPEAAGLALDPAGERFLAEELSAGRPVDAAGLAAAVGDEARLLTLAAGEGPLAQGAMAGLAAAAGADAAGQAGAVAAMSEADAAPADAWPAIRDRLRLAQLARAAGSYRLLVTTGPAAADAASPEAVSVIPGRGDAGGDTPVNAATEVRLVDLGVVVLSVTDTGLRMAGDPVSLTLAPDRPAIRLEDPLQLSNFPGDAILTVPLAAAVGPLDLLETPTGWRGSVPLGAGGRLGVEMVRAGDP